MEELEVNKSRCFDDDKLLKFSHEILEKFYQEPVDHSHCLKKQLTLEVEVEFTNEFYMSGAFIKFKIGDDKLYHLNNKMYRFLVQYVSHEEKI